MSTVVEPSEGSRSSGASFNGDSGSLTVVGSGELLDARSWRQRAPTSLAAAGRRGETQRTPTSLAADGRPDVAAVDEASLCPRCFTSRASSASPTSPSLPPHRKAAIPRVWFCLLADVRARWWAHACRRGATDPDGGRRNDLGLPNRDFAGFLHLGASVDFVSSSRNDFFFFPSLFN